MKRFGRFIDAKVDFEKLGDADALSNFSIEARYLPDPPEEFDEIELGANFRKKGDAGILIAIEQGAIKRIITGLFDADDPEVLRPFDRELLEQFLSKRGDDILAFLEYVTLPD